nr:glycosyltransferase [Phormidium sp. FACHB-592]
MWDDGSTDGSLVIAQYYAAQDDRLRVIAAPHQGLAPALKSASGDRVVSCNPEQRCNVGQGFQPLKLGKFAAVLPLSASKKSKARSSH